MLIWLFAREQLQQRFCSESIVQPKSSLILGTRNWRKKTEKPNAWANVSVCAFAGLWRRPGWCTFQSLYHLQDSASCCVQGPLVKSREWRGVRPQGGVMLERREQVTPLNQVSMLDPLSISDTRTELRQVFWTQEAEILSFCDSDTAVPVQ